MRKICAITANRADFSRQESILRAVLAHAGLELQLVVIGGHLSAQTGFTVEEIRKKGFVIDRTIETHKEEGTPTAMTQSVGVAIEKLAAVLEELRPDIVIAPTDRFETLAIGVAAALMNIHVAHIQGGEVTGTIDESIRHALSKLSHLHFVSTEKSGERVLKMGELASSVYMVGCPATDLLVSEESRTRAETVAALNEIQITSAPISDEPFLLFMQHPVTTEFGDAATQIEASLEAVLSFGMPVIALIPNVDAGRSEIVNALMQRAEQNPKLHLFTHIPTDVFVNTLRHAVCQVGNSSSGIREACYFGTPVVNIGTRQNSRERGENVVDVENDTGAIRDAIHSQIEHGPYAPQYVYGDGTAGVRIAEILAVCELPPIQKKITY